MFGPSRDKTTPEQRLPPAGTGQRHSGGEEKRGGARGSEGHMEKEGSEVGGRTFVRKDGPGHSSGEIQLRCWVLIASHLQTNHFGKTSLQHKWEIYEWEVGRTVH